MKQHEVDALTKVFLDEQQRLYEKEKARYDAFNKTQFGFSMEKCPNKIFFENELAELMEAISRDNSKAVINQTGHTYSATWFGHPIKELASVDYLDV